MCFCWNKLQREAFGRARATIPRCLLRRGVISRDGRKLHLIPFPCNCQADIFLMGLHSTITRTPLLNEKPVTKWRRRTLADPILKNWQQTAENCACIRVSLSNSGCFCHKSGGAPEVTAACLDSPPVYRILG